MSRCLGTRMRVAIAAAIFGLFAAGSALAQGPPQGPGGPPPGGGRGGPGFPGGGPGMGGGPPQRGPGGDNHAGLELGPPGRWWDDKQFASTLRLRPEQQTRMDAIFDQNRSVLLARFEAVQQAEAQMRELTKSPAPEEAALFAQIDRISQARANLEKANTHLLLLIRKEMDASQINLLEQQTPH